MSSITVPFTNPEAKGVNPLTPAGAVAVSINETNPEVKVLGL